MAGKADKATIVIRREEVVEGGHHGGAWKVAYADFVTAMMAFFLLMWLLNATTEKQKRGVADYFSATATIVHHDSGYGKPFGGRTMNADGSLASDMGQVQVTPTNTPIVELQDDIEDSTPPKTLQRQVARGMGGTDVDQPSASQAVAKTPPKAPGQSAQAGDQAFEPTAAERAAPSDADLQAELEKRERATFERAAQQIRDAVRADPALADLMPQLKIDIVPEGLRVQLVDEDKQPMFPTGSAVLNERAREVLQKVAPVLMRLPQSVSIAGHTDSAPFHGGERSNWDLSADRANATRRLLVDAGLPESRLRSVSGMADRDPLVPDDTMAAANRRIAITVLRDSRVAGGH